MASIIRAPFRQLTEAELNRPTLVSLTEGEKLMIATTLGKPDQARFLEKHMAACLTWRPATSTSGFVTMASRP